MLRRLGVPSSSSAAVAAVSVLTSSSALATATNQMAQVRGIRTQIPPRPLVTVVTYLDKGGNPIRNRVETELAIVKTRDNKFWLQRVMENGSYVRWRIPGLDKMKNAASFETFSMHDIDEGGGVHIPFEAAPWALNTPPEYNDAIIMINNLKTLGKITRKDRRYYNRELYTRRKEHALKNRTYWETRLVLAFIIIVYTSQRAFAAYTNERNFLDTDVYLPRTRRTEKELSVQRILSFGDNHPEHMDKDHRQFMASPGQMQLSLARKDLHGADVATPDETHMLWWQLNHLFTFHHWPKALDAD